MEGLFKNAGLEEEYKILIKNGINSLLLLQDSMNKRREKFEEMFCCIGTQLRLERLCSEGGNKDDGSHVLNRTSNGEHSQSSRDEQRIGNSDSEESSTSTIVPTGSLPGVISLANATVEVGDSISNQNIQTEEITVVLIATAAADQKYDYKPQLTEVANFDLQALLESSAKGQAILSIYKARQIFSSAEQGHLCEIISNYFLDGLPDTYLENEDIEFLAHKIHDQFPNEAVETYYIGPVLKEFSKTNRSVVATGKLRNKYSNDWRYIQNAKKLKIDDSLTSVKKTVGIDPTGINSKIWLNHNLEEEYKVLLHHWLLSHTLRIQEIKAIKKRSFELIRVEWLVLSLSESYKLIQVDFEQLYELSYVDYCLNWDEAFRLLKIVLKEKIEEAGQNIFDQGTSPESIGQRQLTQFPWLNEFLPPRSNKIILRDAIGRERTVGRGKSKTTLTWHPTASEATEGLVLLVESTGDIDSQIRERIKKLSSMKLELKPFIIVVAPNESEIEHVEIYASKEARYIIPSFSEAVYVLFQLYIVYELPYPVESEVTSYFIQWQIFGIRLKSDTGSSFVADIVNRMKLI